MTMIATIVFTTAVVATFVVITVMVVVVVASVIWVKCQFVFQKCCHCQVSFALYTATHFNPCCCQCIFCTHTHTAADENIYTQDG